MELESPVSLALAGRLFTVWARMCENSGPQLFWHQRLVLWKTVFAQTEVEWMVWG